MEDIKIKASKRNPAKVSTLPSTKMISPRLRVRFRHNPRPKPAVRKQIGTACGSNDYNLIMKSATRANSIADSDVIQKYFCHEFPMLDKSALAIA
jgi:hypothetical protein